MEEEIIGKRERVWRAVVPLVFFAVTTALLFIFRNWIIENVLAIFPPWFTQTFYWVFTIAYTVAGIVKNIDFFVNFFSMVHVLRMPRRLLVLKPLSVVLAKAVKVTDEDVLAAIADAVKDVKPPRWLDAKQISAEDIWDEDWFGEAEIVLKDIKAIIYLACAKRSTYLGRLLQEEKPVRGALIVVTKEDGVFVQPKLADLRPAYGRLPKV